MILVIGSTEPLFFASSIAIHKYFLIQSTAKQKSMAETIMSKLKG
jgi:hypothetical protein